MGRIDLIDIKNLIKTYYMGKIEVPALRGIDIKIEHGEVVALMGPSGSGKSTLLNMIGLLDTPTSGGIIVDGIDVSSLNDNQRADFRLKKMGFVFQFFSLLMELNSFENVALPMIMDERKYDRAASLLDLVGLGAVSYTHLTLPTI